ncbi:hypothetical protein [Ornithinibacillus californiensis]|uniref:hypothetical protein n=1 Tax=Ornithinibacillus californiensis TaxID=161536 RepID=UPI00069D2D5A|nr:hypothetical protein [Ornithinibacillus californiensis]
MSMMLALLLIICALPILGVMLLNITYRIHLTTMHGMVVAMTVGMLSGIFFGTVIGFLLNGDLFTSTIISILIGLTLGFLVGIPFGIVSVIDGSVSGLMGGMMGAMLGEMIPMSNPDSIIKLLAFFTIMLFLITASKTEDSIKSQHVKVFFSVRKYPFIYIFIIAILFFLLRDVPIISLDNNHQH